MSRATHLAVKLPEEWWEHLVDHYQRWDYETLEEFCADTPTISSKTLYRAKTKGQMTARTLERLARKLDHPTQSDLLADWRAKSAKRAQELPADNPAAFTLTARKELPQWVDYRELSLGGRRLEVLKCNIETDSAYFRFGFKLLAEDGRLFGDGQLQSQAANLLLHIGRNDWNRPSMGISAKDIFFTWYLNGVSKEPDRKLFRSTARLTASLEFSIGNDYVTDLSVNGRSCLRRVIAPGICRRVVVLAWGDRNPCAVEVRNLSVTSATP